MNTSEKLDAMKNWYEWQTDALLQGLKSIADAEKLYDYWQSKSDLLPEFADEEDDEGKVDVVEHLKKAVGYNPFDN